MWETIFPYSIKNGNHKFSNKNNHLPKFFYATVGYNTYDFKITLAQLCQRDRMTIKHENAVQFWSFKIFFIET